LLTGLAQMKVYRAAGTECIHLTRLVHNS